MDETDRKFLDLAVAQAQTGWEEGGVPIGASIAHRGELLAVGRNRRHQRGSVIRHGETDCLENAGRQHASVYRESVIYTTLSPCFMCAGAILLYGIPRVVVGENRNFQASEDFLRAQGVAVEVVDDADCRALMERMRNERPQMWAEDIGEEA